MDAPEPLVGRYRFVRALRTAKTPCWLAVDETNGAEVVASVVPSPRARGLAPLVGFLHPHVATILDVLENVPSTQLPAAAPQNAFSVAVATHIAGSSLHQRVETAPIEPERAVRWIQLLAGALAAMHARGGFHGAISPRSVVVSRVLVGQAPLLTHLVAPPSGAYCSPARVTGGGPSAHDDVWALAATLYAALARHPPFHGATRTELARAIVAAAPESLSIDAELDAIVRGGLKTTPEDRSSAQQLHDGLDAWLSARGPAPDERFDTQPPAVLPFDRPSTTDDSMIRSAFADPETEEARRPVSEPPGPAAPDGGKAAGAIPPSDHAAASEAARPAGIVSTTKGVRERPRPSGGNRAMTWTLAVVALILAGAAAAFLLTRSDKDADAGHSVASLPSARSPPPRSAPETEGPAAPVASPGSEPAAPTAAASPGGTSPSTDETPGQCVAGLFPTGTFTETPKADYLCQETDLWLIGRKFYSQMTRDGSGDGMVMWVHLGRRELPVLARMRSRCCRSPTSLKVAVPDTPCGPLTEVVKRAASDLTGEGMNEYVAAIDCLIRRQVRTPEPWSRVSEDKSTKYFRKMLDQLAR